MGHNVGAQIDIENAKKILKVTKVKGALSHEAWQEPQILK